MGGGGGSNNGKGWKNNIMVVYVNHSTQVTILLNWVRVRFVHRGSSLPMQKWIATRNFSIQIMEPFVVKYLRQLQVQTNVPQRFDWSQTKPRGEGEKAREDKE